MPKKKQAPSTTNQKSRDNKSRITKSMVEWVILIFLILLIPISLLSGFASFGYYYLKCNGLPLELSGSYYRIPGDKGYGIHGGSDYSNCSYNQPLGAQRDPSTKMGAKLAKTLKDSTDFSHSVDGYDVYVPKDYAITALGKSHLGDGIATGYFVTTNSNVKFYVREMKKDSNYSYTNLCSKPAEGSWSGKVISKDSQGREVCRTYSRYVTEYVVGINIGGTGIMLEAPLKGNSEEVLNTEATAIFSSMKPYSE